MTKCIYCDFNHPDHIGAEIYSDEYIPEEVMYESEWSNGYEYAYLKQKNGYFFLVTLHKETGIKPGIYHDAYFTLGDEKLHARRIKVMIEE